MPDLKGKVHGFELAESSYNVKKKKKKKPIFSDFQTEIHSK